MAVTVTTHTQAGTWTATQLRSLFETSFIANGIMTAWYDSFTSGSNEIGVVERVYDAGATYGTTYYIFKFNTSRILVYDCDSWDATSHVPNGIIHDTYAGGYNLSSTTGGNGDYIFMNVLGGASDATAYDYGSTNRWSFSTTTTLELRCFTSTVDSSFKWFQLRQGSNYGSFAFPNAVATNIDLDQFLMNGLITVGGYANGPRYLDFVHICNGPRRSVVCGSVVGADTALSLANAGECSSVNITYLMPTSDATTVVSNGPTASNTGRSGIKLPTLRTDQLTSGPASDLFYIHTGCLYSTFCNPFTLPSDFGVYVAESGEISIRNLDTLVVSAGVQEYTILHALPASANVVGKSWGAFVARTV